MRWAVFCGSSRLASRKKLRAEPEKLERVTYMSGLYVKPFSSNTGTSRTDGRTELLYQYCASFCWRAIKTILETWDYPPEKMPRMNPRGSVECMTFPLDTPRTYSPKHFPRQDNFPPYLGHSPVVKAKIWKLALTLTPNPNRPTIWGRDPNPNCNRNRLMGRE